jgi:molybdopterin converting factor small subunit
MKIINKERSGGDMKEFLYSDFIIHFSSSLEALPEESTNQCSLSNDTSIVRVLLFASIKDLIGTPAINCLFKIYSKKDDVFISQPTLDINIFFCLLGLFYPALNPFISSPSVLICLNMNDITAELDLSAFHLHDSTISNQGTHVKSTLLVTHNDQVAFIPPVSGG